MKLRKLKLNEASKAELNEREMCRVLGGGTPGCCQCGCNYEGKPGGSSTSANDSANNAHGYTSDVLIHVVLLLTPNRNFRNFRIFLLCLKMLFVGRLKDTRVVYENN